MKKTWKQIIDEYLESWVEEGHEVKTAKNYVRSIRRIGELINKCDTDDVYGLEFVAPSETFVYDYMEEINNKYSPSTVTNAKNGIVTFYNFLYKKGYISKKIEFHFSNLKKNKQELQALLTKREIDDVSKSCGITERVMVQLAFETGLNAYKISELRIRQFIIEDGKLVIFPSSYDIDKLKIVDLNDKTVLSEMERVCNLSDELTENLKVRIRHANQVINKIKKTGVENVYDFLFIEEDIDIPSKETLRSYTDKLKRHYFRANDDVLSKAEKDKIKERFNLERITLSARVWYLANGETIEEVMNRHGIISKTLVSKYKKLVNVYYGN